MTIIYNTNYTHNPNSYLTLAVARAARDVFGADNVTVADNRTLAPLAATGEHSVLICLDGQRLNRKVIERVRPAFAAVVLWLFEDPFMLDYNKAHADLFDYVLTNDPACVTEYEGKGHYLPLAASPSLHHRAVLPEAQLEYDIFFAGTMWPNRVKTVRHLLQRFPSKRFKLVCPTNMFLPPLPRDIAAHAIQWPINHESFVDFANASRVTLTMFRDYASHGTASQASAPGPRLFELGLAGTAQVVELDPGMRREPFSIVDGVTCCNDLPGLVREIERLLDGPALRSKMAVTAQRSVADRHRYDDRLRQMARITGTDFTRRAPPAAPAPAGKMRILMCTHSTMREAEWGGVEVYQQFLITALADTVEVFFWLRKGTTCSLKTSLGEQLESFAVEDVGWLDSLTDAREETVFANVIAQYEIDVVHFQHLGHHTASLPIIAKASGAGTVVSAHDFFLVCSRYNLLDHSAVFCDIGNRSITACDICLRIAEGVPPGGQEIRRTFMAEMLRSVDVVLFGTEYSEQLTLKIYPDLKHRRRMVLGIPTPREVVQAPQPRPSRDRAAPLKVAVLGNFLRSKGADTVVSVIETLDPALFEFHIIGKAEPQYLAVIHSWNRANVTYHGRYEAGELGPLDTCDVSLHLSIWPETFCISLSEAWQRGVVPIVTELGGLRDRVDDGRNGFVVPVGDADAVIGRLELLRSDPLTLATMQAAISPELWGRAGAHAAAVTGLYRSLKPIAKLGMTALGFDVGQVHLLPHASWRDLSPPRHIFDPPRRSELSIDLPANIKEWVYPLEVPCRIDSISGNTIDRIEQGVFHPAADVEVDGWTFAPDMGISGQVHIVLIGEGDMPTLYLKAVRIRRDDVFAKVGGAPLNAGFKARATLHGKWSNGRYRLGVINVVNDRGRFNLTPMQVTLHDGRVVGVVLGANGPAQAAECFARASEQAEAAAPPSFVSAALSGVTILEGPSMRYMLENVANLPRLEPAGADLVPSGRLFIRGWCVQAREMQDAGDLFVALLGDGPAGPVLCRSVREPRPDVRSALNNLVPEASGFAVDLDAPGLPDGRWRVALCNVVGTEAVVEVTRLIVGVRDSHFVQLRSSDVGEEEVAAAHARFRAALEGPADKPGPPAPGPKATRTKPASGRPADAGRTVVRPRRRTIAG